MWVLSESAWGDPSDSLCSATYRTLGSSLEAMASFRSKRSGQRQRENAAEKDGCKVCQVQRESEYERRSRGAESGVWQGERGVGGEKRRGWQMGQQAPGHHARPLADFLIQGQLWKRCRNNLLIRREEKRGAYRISRKEPQEQQQSVSLNYH